MLKGKHVIIAVKHEDRKSWALTGVTETIFLNSSVDVLSINPIKRVFYFKNTFRFDKKLWGVQ